MSSLAPAASSSIFPTAWLPAPRPIGERFSAWLDLFRWLAAFVVCSSHVRSVVLTAYDPAGPLGWLAAPGYLLTAFGHEAVIIFFVLSGYLIGGEVLRGLWRGDFDGRRYAVRRVSRLYAVYVAALLLGALWDWIGLHYFNTRGTYTTGHPGSPMLFYDISARLDGATFLGNLGFTQTILVPTLGSNSPLWSLANEAWYYALFPLAAWPLFANASAASRIGCVAAFAAAAWFVRGNLLLYFTLWLIGAAVHFLPRAVLRAPWVAPLGMILVLAAPYLHLPFVFPSFARHLLLALAFGLWLNSLEFGAWRAPGPAAWHRYLAGFSYTLYLAHWPLTLLLCAVLDQIFGVGWQMPPGLPAAACAVGLLGVVYVYSLALAALTEHRTASLRAWFLKVTALAPPTAAPNKA